MQPHPLAHEYKRSIIADFFVAMHRTVADNYDARRFNVDGRDHSREFQLTDHAYFLDWFYAHHDALLRAQLLLADETSRQIFRALVLYRLGGHLHVRIPSAPLRHADKLARFNAVARPQPSGLALNGLFGELVRYDFEWEGARYTIDCTPGSLACTLVHGQYRYERDGLRIAPEPGDHVVDGGACLGDTALLFSNCVGPNGRVYAFDPVEDHLLMCLENTRLMAHQNVSVLPVGLAAENVDAPPIRLGGYAPGFNAGSQAEAPVPVRTLDHLVASGEIERMDFIKLDIEGAELDALRGGVQSIRQFRPKMAISLYHKPNDLFEIIQFVAAEFPFYELHLDHYTIHREETVLYCLPTGAGGH